MNVEIELDCTTRTRLDHLDAIVNGKRVAVSREQTDDCDPHVTIHNKGGLSHEEILAIESEAMNWSPSKEQK